MQELPRSPLASINVFALQAQCSGQTRGGGFQKMENKCLQMPTAHPLERWWSSVLLYRTCLVSQNRARQIAHSAHSRLMHPRRCRPASGSMEALSWCNEKFSLIKERAIWHTGALKSLYESHNDFPGFRGDISRNAHAHWPAWTFPLKCTCSHPLSLTWCDL